MAAKQLAELDEQLGKTLAAMSDWTAEARILQILMEIENRQRGMSQDLQQRWLDEQLRIMRELLKDAPDKKK